ncbi:MAG: hypothetical protein HC915_07995 [Anaerolineae bacterium]|nr:hypothetical protein [Anaerolineae bacterium]
MKGTDILRTFHIIHALRFADVLQALLDERGCTKSELHTYLLRRGFAVEKPRSTATSMAIACPQRTS